MPEAPSVVRYANGRGGATGARHFGATQSLIARLGGRWLWRTFATLRRYVNVAGNRLTVGLERTDD